MPQPSTTGPKKTPTSALQSTKRNTGSANDLNVGRNALSKKSSANMKRTFGTDDSVRDSLSGVSKLQDSVVVGAGVEQQQVAAEGFCLSGDQIAELQLLDLQDAYNKMAQFLGYANWKEDIANSIMLSFYFGIYQFAKENGFSVIQTNMFLSIMKLTLTSIMGGKSGPPLTPLNSFKKLVLTNSAPVSSGTSETPFSFEESRLICDFATSGLFQHYKLYQHVATQEQEKIFTSASMPTDPLAILLDPPSLADAVTLEAFEAEQARLKELQELARMDREHREAEERAAAANPFGVLSTEEVKQIAAETVNAMLSSVSVDLDGLLDEQRDKLTQQVVKMANLFP